MSELIMWIFFLHIVIYLVTDLGADTINALLWHLYLKIPSSTSRNVREQQKKKIETLELKREMNNTSSQDEFAKWAKLRRRHDKSVEEHEELNKITSAEKSSFDSTVRIARWLSTNGLKIFLQFYYTKTPMFALPEGWLPYPVEWVLSFPKAPVGTVSIQMWSNVCAAAIAQFAEILGGVIVQLARKPATAPKAQSKTQ